MNRSGTLSAEPRNRGAPSANLAGRLIALYEELARAYGPQDWWPGGGGFEMVVGAILTQRTSWPNAERALANLREAGALMPAALLALPEGQLLRLVRPAGCMNAKARSLRALSQMVTDEFAGSLERLLELPLAALRARLLTTPGIGPETADAIVLYASVQPTFVIDAYTRRIFSRLGISPTLDSYESWRALFMQALPADARLFKEYHALLVRHANVSCRTRPRCASCVLRHLCPFGCQTQSAPPPPPGEAGPRAVRRTEAQAISRDSYLIKAQKISKETVPDA